MNVDQVIVAANNRIHDVYKTLYCYKHLLMLILHLEKYHLNLEYCHLLYDT